jgi:hypothetical protein
MRVVFYILFILTVSVWVFCVQAAEKTPLAAAQRPKASKTKAKAEVPSGKAFAKEVLRYAVSVQQSDAQDRLRVLRAAIDVASSVDRQMVKDLVRQGMQAEADVIATEKTPVASVMQFASCKDKLEFSQRIYPSNLVAAEDSLIAASGNCPEVASTVSNLVVSGLKQNIAAPKLIASLVESGNFNQQQTSEMLSDAFSSLPKDAYSDRALDFASLYATLAPRAGKREAMAAGLKFFDWLALMGDDENRNAAANAVFSSMQEILGEEQVRSALQEHPAASELMAGVREGPPPNPADDTADPASADSGKPAAEQLEDLNQLPAMDRAKQAASLGFSKGTSSRDPGIAAPYFDIAFSAADSAWTARTEEPATNAATSMMTEVCEAAAHVDAVSAFQRAQRLSDPTAQAICMIAVARVVSAGE